MKDRIRITQRGQTVLWSPRRRLPGPHWLWPLVAAMIPLVVAGAVCAMLEKYAR